jgi:hypothetical protein
VQFGGEEHGFLEQGDAVFKADGFDQIGIVLFSVL